MRTDKTDKSTSNCPRSLREAFGCSVKAEIEGEPSCRIRTAFICALQCIGIITVIMAVVVGFTYWEHLEQLATTTVLDQPQTQPQPQPQPESAK